MSTKPIIAVLGATGAQGGSVARTLIATGKYVVRGLTRDPTSAKAKELEKIGVRVVQADSNNSEALGLAFDGAYGVFAVTNFWDPSIYPNNIGLEKTQGLTIIDAAVKAKVQHFIWSSLPDVHGVSGGKLDVPHFSGKHDVEKYARQQNAIHPEFHVSFYYAAAYLSYLAGPFGAKLAADGVAEFGGGRSAIAKVPFIDADADTGPLVAQMFADRKKWNGKTLLGASEYLTSPETVAIYTSVTGKPARHVDLSEEQQLASGLPIEIIDTIKWFNNYGYYAGADISEAKKLHPGITTFEQWLKKTGFTVTSK